MEFSLSSDRFPVGTSVGVYDIGLWPGAGTPPPTRAPNGTAVDTQTIASSGTATFDGLEPDTAYWAVASVSGGYRWVRFRTTATSGQHIVTTDPEDEPFTIVVPNDVSADLIKIEKVDGTVLFEIGAAGLDIAADLAAEVAAREAGDAAEVAAREAGDAALTVDLAAAIAGVGAAQTENGDFTVDSTMAGRVVEVTAAANVTLPSNTTDPMAVGSIVEIVRMHTGAVTFVADAGVTIYSRAGALSIGDQYASVSARKRGLNNWVLVGNLV
jgi:hypothetical protein